MANETSNEPLIPITGAPNASAVRRDSESNRRVDGCALGTAGFAGLLLIVVGTTLICVWGLVRWLSAPAPSAPPEPTIVVSNGPTITQLQSIGSLAVLKVSIADVLEASGSGYKGSWLIKGDALISVDCRSAGVRDVDPHGKTAVIVLPPPSVIQPRVDHTRTREWSVEKTTWVPYGGNEGALRGEAMRQAQLLVEEAVKKPEVLDQARQNAQIVIENMYRLVDWQVSVRWSDAPSTSPVTGGS